MLCVAAASGSGAAVVDRVKAAIADQPWSELADGLRVTVSCGSAELGPVDTATTVFYNADQELLAAKRARLPANPVPAAVREDSRPDL